ncbi:MAG: stage V sporulation protein AD [Eubacteriales bacterium]|nr:stage V sporulation protein AD [Eubacteriales bacterium]
MNQMCGQQSIRLEQPPHVIGAASVVGKKESEGPLGDLFGIICEDDMFGEESWEKAESRMQTESMRAAMSVAGKRAGQVRCLFGGDLLGQLIATSFGVEELNIPLLGVYGACSTCGEALALAAMMISGGYADCVATVTSSHFASAEKQFRFPLGYGNQRPLAATWTVTGSGAFVLASQGGHVRITGVTMGRVVDYDVHDSMNMGACMAPAAADTISRNLRDFGRTPEDYDRIITGDLGYVGQTILMELMREQGFEIRQQHMDCGIEIYDRETQDTHSGGSGCGCSAVTLAAMILPKIEKGEWKRILFVPTGALLSTVSFNEGQSVPGIAHGLVIEHC